MRKDSQYVDLRLLSLLHAIGAAEDFKELVSELRKTRDVDGEIWRQICVMGRELAPYDPSFQCNNPPDGPDFPQTSRPHQPVADSRCNKDRRTITLTWVGVERRKSQRRR